LLVTQRDDKWWNEAGRVEDAEECSSASTPGDAVERPLDDRLTA
jgi:hypothetical protein